MAEDFEVKVDATEWNELMSKIQEKLGPEAQQRLMDKIALIAQRKLVELTPKKTGGTRRAWQIEQPNPNSRVILNVSPVMGYLEFGTKAHGPVSGDFLFFKNQNGQLIRKRWVAGIEAQHIIEKYIPEFEKMTLEEIEKALDEALA